MLTTTDAILNSIQTNQDQLRSAIHHDYLNFIKKKKKLTTAEKQILHLLKITKQFLKDNPEIYVVNSDKGHQTILIEKEEYNAKVTQHLSDKATYEKLKKTRKCLHKTIEEEYNEKLEHLGNTKQISREQYKQLKAENSIPPRLYAAIKNHKAGNPIRPIISTINAPTSKMAKHLNEIIFQAVEHKFDIKNSFTFKDEIENLVLEENDVLASFDVVALYTNVDQDEAIEAVKAQWGKIRPLTNIKKKEFFEMLELCVKKSNFFVYGGETYKQKYGLPMGSSLSGTLAGLVVDKLFENALRKFKPKILKKYVDDSIVIDKAENIDQLFNYLNSLHQTIQFTMEKEENYRINFLDMTLIRERNKIVYDWYKKKMASDRILNWLSAHPQKMKLNNGISFANRVLSLSNEKFHNKNYKIIEDILAKNNYPANIIKSIMYKSKRFIRERPAKKLNEGKKYRKCTFVPVISDCIQKRLKDTDFRLGMKPARTLRTLFTNTKEKISKKKIGQVYKIPCKECDKVYIGSTLR